MSVLYVETVKPRKDKLLSYGDTEFPAQIFFIM
jgi:hypothetical protein